MIPRESPQEGGTILRLKLLKRTEVRPMNRIQENCVNEGQLKGDSNVE